MSRSVRLVIAGQRVRFDSVLATMDNNNWLGRKILSQYGLICTVEKVDGNFLFCREHRRNKLWEWSADTVSLITRNNEILDPYTNEVYGRINQTDNGEDWDLYAEHECRMVTQQEVENEFNARD